jgi:hypothetical protein
LTCTGERIRNLDHWRQNYTALGFEVLHGRWRRRHGPDIVGRTTSHVAYSYSHPIARNAAIRNPNEHVTRIANAIVKSKIDLSQPLLLGHRPYVFNC